MWTGEKIRRLRKRFGETQAEFAKRLDVTEYTIRHWERDLGKPSGPACIVLTMLKKQLENPPCNS